MTLQREYREGGKLIWRDYMVEGGVVKSPVDIDALPPGHVKSLGVGFPETSPMPESLTH